MNFWILMIWTVLMIVILGVVVAMAIYVAKDAKANNMNAVLWVLIVIFVPNFLGLVIYLIVRSSSAKKSACYQCGKQVENDYSICPFCKAELTMHCRGCDKVLSTEWNSCPYCGQEVAATQVTRVATKEKGLKGIVILIIAVFIVPIILCLFIVICGVFFFRTDISDISAVTEVRAVENNFGRTFEYRAMRFNGEKVDTIKVKKDGYLCIASSVNYESGDLKVRLYSEEEEFLYEFNINGEDDYKISVIEGQQYVIKIEGQTVENINAHFQWDYVNE